MFNVKRNMLLLFNESRWALQKYHLIKYYKKIIPSGKITLHADEGTNLILIPHADDEWIGCSQIVKMDKSSGFYFNFLGSDVSTQNEENRLSELNKMSSSFDFRVRVSQGSVEEELYLLLKHGSFNNIFLPSFLDWHQEHILVNSILHNVILRFQSEDLEFNSTLYLYQVSVPLPFDLLNTYIPLSCCEQKNKWKFFNNFYISQRHLPVKRFQISERVNGYFCGQHASEVFAKMTVSEWVKRFEAFLSFHVDLRFLKESINDIYTIRLIINHHFSKIG